MRRTLGTSLALTLLTALLLTGCSEDTDEPGIGDATASDPAASSTPSPTEPEQTDGDAEAPADYDVVALVSETAAGGRTSPMLTSVDTANSLDAFVSQFRLDTFADEIRTEATTAPYDGELWAAVVSVGCDVPPGVFVEEGEAGYLITPQKVAKPLQECLAAVTTVALVAIR
jgi:hypothetical protein